MKIAPAAAIVSFLLLLSAPTALCGQYRDQEFRFTLSWPEKLNECGPRMDSSDHGVSFLLPPTTCADLPFRDGVTVYAGYSAPYEPLATHELSAILCKGTAITRSVLKVDGVVFDRCGPTRTETGWRTEWVGLRKQSGTWAGDSTVIGASAFASDSRHFAKYREIAERALRTLIFW